MSFEKKSLCIVVPLDPTKGPCYIEPVHDYKSDENLDQIYKITVRDQDWVNLAADGYIAFKFQLKCHPLVLLVVFPLSNYEQWL